ncbi:MAG: ATP-binding protein [bacterium]
MKCENSKNTVNLSEILKNSDKLAIFTINEKGRINFANKAAFNILGIKTEKELSLLNIQKIFDFRISEIKNELVKSNEIYKEINILNQNRSFIPTKTVFLKIENDEILAFVLPEESQPSKDSMSKLIFTLSKISEILNSTFDPDKILEIILNELEAILNYDKALIMFLDGDSLILKASKGLDEVKDKEYKKTKNSSLLNKVIRNHKTSLENITSSSNSIIKELGLKIELPYSYIATPLTIRETLFGLIIIIKEQGKFFGKEDVKISEAFASCVSYSIKDAELSNIFKMQLKILKENVIERTKSFEIIKEQNLKILEADKLKNEFLANISHEFRTPLNAIIGFSEALNLKIFGSLNEKQEEYIDDIHTSGIHLLGMINDLLDLSKIEANEMQLYKRQFSVYEAVSEVINVVRALANKKKISIEVLCDDKNINIFADYRKFQQILYNLLSNATKFTPENGQIKIGINKIDDKIKIYVKDNGIGIDSKFHEKIFIKFQQIDSSYVRKQGSTGLGLTITKELIEMHGGKIWVESSLTKGAIFTFALPLNENETE